MKVWIYGERQAFWQKAQKIGYRPFGSDSAQTASSEIPSTYPIHRPASSEWMPTRFFRLSEKFGAVQWMTIFYPLTVKV